MATGAIYVPFSAGQGHKMPIIMLTGLNAEEDVVRGLEAGASDYIAKPFRVNELFARLRTQLRIFDDTADAAFTIGPYIFRPAARTLQDSMTDRRSRLTDKEAAILKYLYRADAKPVDREMLCNRSGATTSSVTGHALETHIYRLRQKMEPDPTNPALLLTDGSRLSPGPADGSRGRIGYRPSLNPAASQRPPRHQPPFAEAASQCWFADGSAIWHAAARAGDGGRMSRPSIADG